ncbi:unnamed protein product [Blumeria hordei]|uniref:Uncharacterized protein n=1 Tax=Blumeria hordei TaxID=2867405 RepID=A0A383UL55_BLUHO|nr:unnamed protein product [Blumeria hordei]
MSTPKYCNHSFHIIKSETTLIQWACYICHSGPHWLIFQCKYCNLKTCHPLIIEGFYPHQYMPKNAGHLI